MRRARADAALATTIIGERNRETNTKSSAIKALEREGLNVVSTPRPIDHNVETRVVDEKGEDRPNGKAAHGKPPEAAGGCCVVS